MDHPFVTGRLGGAFLFVEHLPSLVLLGCTSSTSHGPSLGAGGKATRGPGYFLFHAMGAGLFSETEKGFRGVISLWKKTARGWKITKNHIGCMYVFFYSYVQLVDFMLIFILNISKHTVPHGFRGFFFSEGTPSAS